jgi:hypothetical protein
MCLSADTTPNNPPPGYNATRSDKAGSFNERPEFEQRVMLQNEERTKKNNAQGRKSTILTSMETNNNSIASQKNMLGQ